jgi:hypothetical protein
MQKVKMTFVGKDGNPFALMGAWGRAALDQGWREDAIDRVIKEAMAGDYQHLLATLTDHSDPGALFGTDDETDPIDE